MPVLGDAGPAGGFDCCAATFAPPDPLGRAVPPPDGPRPDKSATTMVGVFFADSADGFVLSLARRQGRAVSVQLLRSRLQDMPAASARHRLGKPGRRPLLPTVHVGRRPVGACGGILWRGSHVCTCWQHGLHTEGNPCRWPWSGRCGRWPSTISPPPAPQHIAPVASLHRQGPPPPTPKTNATPAVE